MSNCRCLICFMLIELSIKLILLFRNMVNFLADIISLNVKMNSSESHQQ